MEVGNKFQHNIFTFSLHKLGYRDMGFEYHYSLCYFSIILMEFPVVHKNYLLTYCHEKKFACEGYEKKCRKEKPTPSTKLIAINLH